MATTTTWPEYTTVANLKAYGDTLQSKDDSLLDGLIKSFSMAVERYMQQSFLTTAINQINTGNFYNAKVDRDGFLLVYPFMNPVNTISALQYRLRGTGTTGWQTLDATQVEVTNKDSGVILRIGTPDFSVFRNAGVQVQLNITGGYTSADDLPPDLEFAVRRLVWWAYKQKGAPMERTAIPETGQVIVPGYWPQDIRTLLDPFKCYYTR